MTYDSSNLFNKKGYISLNDYVRDIREMMKKGPWRLPLGLGDRFHFYLLFLFSKVSWFSEHLFIRHSDPFSPAYSLLLTYLKKKEVYDYVFDKSVSRRGYYSFLFEKKLERNGEILRIYGQGVSLNKSTALSIAMGEIIERTVTGLYDTNKDIFYSSANELMARHTKIVYPPIYHRFLEVQKKKVTSLGKDVMNIPIAWVVGWNVRTGNRTLIPKKLTSWFKERQGDKEILLHATTNGSAGYFSKQEALLRGILEVVQRDGFLVHWLTKISPEVIDIESLPGNLYEMVARFKQDGIQVHLLNTTSLGIPTVTFVGIGKSVTGKPQICVSSASALAVNEAIESAVKELVVALEMLTYPKDLSDLERLDKVIEPFTSNLDKIGRQIYWRGEDKIKQFAWFISGKRIKYKDFVETEIKAGGDINSKLEKCLLTLSMFGEGYDPIVYYPSNPIQDKIGFYVVQIFIEKAFPLYLFEGYGTFDSDRLKDFTASKGVRSYELNPDPHMFS